MDLKISKPSAVQWIAGGGLSVRSPVLIASEGPVPELTAELKEARGITIEAWVKPADLQQAGPARIFTLSRDASQRNFTLGQMGPGYEVRFRTTKTSPNGEPAVASRTGGGGAARHIAAAATPEGDLAVLYLPVGGKVKVNTEKLSNGLKALWCNPRTGRREPAKSLGDGVFQSPDPEDWVLVFTHSL